MKLCYLLLVLLLTCTAETWQASVFSHRLHRTLKRDVSLSSGLPPEPGNTTNLLCFTFSLPDIARDFGEVCSTAFAQLDDPSLGPEEEKKALVDVCTKDCIGRVIQFFIDDCQNDIFAGALLSFCAKSPSGEHCHNALNAYNWTTFNAACPLSLDGNLPECSEKCSEASLEAMEAAGCCSNYDHLMTLSVSTCRLETPQDCPDPLQVKEEEEEEEKEEDGDDDKTEGEGSDKTGNDKSSDNEQVEEVEESSDLNTKPFSSLTISLFILYLVFS